MFIFDQPGSTSTLPLACVQAKLIDKQTILIPPPPLQEVAVYVCLEMRMGYKEKRNHAIFRLTSVITNYLHKIWLVLAWCLDTVVCTIIHPITQGKPAIWYMPVRIACLASIVVGNFMTVVILGNFRDDGSYLPQEYLHLVGK